MPGPFRISKNSHRSNTESKTRTSAQEYRQQQPCDRSADEQRIDAVQDPAVARQQRPHVLDPQIPLDHGLGEVAEHRGGDHGGAEDGALPPVAVQRDRHHDRARRDTGDGGARQAFPRLLRADGGGHLVRAAPAERDAGEVAAYVGADGDDDEGEHPASAVVRREHRGYRGAEQAQVGRGEHGGGDGGDVTSGPAEQAPDQDRDQGQRERGHDGAASGPVGAGHHRGAAERDRDRRDLDVSGLPQRRVQLVQRHQQGRAHVDEERCLDRKQGDQRRAAHEHADPDRGEEVPAGPDAPVRRGRLRRRRALGRGACGAHTSRSSASLCLSSSSICATYWSVSSCRSRSARRTSSSPVSLFFISLSSASLACRLTLRMETRLSSALDLAVLMYSRRRSSVSSGKTTRIITPSFDGFTPRSLFLIAFSIAPRELLSNGWITTIRGSGTWKDASWLSGVWVP